ncbi:gluconate 2-dehydrogenase subunit 3 family protein [Caulobacter sp. KR2-114]|uniref:gluconate 2-dehydrogenase subunit 3 family protein n=1 Tax=Caulobacter sp. KR2-114 TaxID=3400912 RepID=UPI003C0D9CDA
MSSERVDRRRFLVGGALAGAAAGAVVEAHGAAIHDGELGAPPQTIAGEVPWQEGAADVPPGAEGTDFRFFTGPERAFIEAAVDRLIPKSPEGPSGTEANVPFFLDRQLAGPFGRGDHFFLGGPWKAGTPEQGYQLRFAPAQLYRAAIAAVDRYVGGQFSGAVFARLADPDQDKVLKGLEAGTIQLDGGVPAKAFFAMLLQNTKEGYFSDPIYGGNKDMGGWKMIGFPGAHYDYSNWISRHGERVPYPPVGFKGRPGWRES